MKALNSFILLVLLAIQALFFMSSCALSPHERRETRQETRVEERTEDRMEERRD